MTTQELGHLIAELPDKLPPTREAGQEVVLIYTAAVVGLMCALYGVPGTSDQEAERIQNASLSAMEREILKIKREQAARN